MSDPDTVKDLGIGKDGSLRLMQHVDACSQDTYTRISLCDAETGGRIQMPLDHAQMLQASLWLLKAAEMDRSYMLLIPAKRSVLNSLLNELRRELDSCQI